MSSCEVTQREELLHVLCYVVLARAAAFRQGEIQHFGFGERREKQRREKKEIICTRIDTRLFFPRARTLLFSYLSINVPVRLYY